ncbi:MAG: DUF2207 domain-containing protein [Propionibacteriaceae bacterium]|jgi:hypothetical protein|nr:DUF2207 domain-containing protein [Propionibacteriaceae bacterium]
MTMHQGYARRAIQLVLALVTGLVASVVAAAPAQAASATSVVIGAELDRAGVVTVHETLTLGEVAVSQVTQDIPTRVDRDQQRYSFTISDISAIRDGVPVTLERTDLADAIRLSWPAQTGETTLSYTVTGATTATVDGKVSFIWPLFGGLNLDVAQVSGEVAVPAGATNYDCAAGTVGALVTCSTYSAGTHGDTAMTFTHHDIAAQGVVQAEIVFPVGPVAVTQDVAAIWSLGRSLTPGGAQLGLMALVLVLGALGLVGWRHAMLASTDRGAAEIPHFEGGDGLHFVTSPTSGPGMVGTLMDGRVDPIDIVATVLDLAQRGHLLIREQPGSLGGVPDWLLTRRDGADDLKEYERVVLDAVTSDSTTVSNLSGRVAAASDQIQAALYDEMVAVGWFRRLPSRRSPGVVWAWTGLVASVVATCVLIAFTTFALVGFAAMAVAIGALAAAYRSSPVSSTGRAVAVRLEELSRQLRERDYSSIPSAGRCAEISRVLAYAVVLGSWDRWLTAMVAADEDQDSDATDLPWYHGRAGWTMSELPVDLDGFITVMTGRLFART